MATRKRRARRSKAELPEAAILKILADIRSDEKLVEQAQSRIAHNKRKFEAAMFFAPSGFNPEKAMRAKQKAPRPKAKRAQTTERRIQRAPKVEQTFLFPVDEPQGDKKTWVSEVYRVVDASPKGIAHQEILEQLKKTPLGENVSAGAKGFYNAIARLTKREKIIKHGSLLFSARVVREMEARGEKLPEPDVQRRPGGSGAIVAEILAKYPEGLTGPQLQQAVSAAPDAPRSVRDHKHYIYNILSGLMGSGLVEKDKVKGTYRLAQPLDGVRH